jgi:CRP-like cAMP-binding protein
MLARTSPDPADRMRVLPEPPAAPILHRLPAVNRAEDRDPPQIAAASRRRARKRLDKAKRTCVINNARIHRFERSRWPPREGCAVHQVSIATGDHLYREGEPAEYAFLVLSGDVAMKRRNVTVTATKGTIIGFSALYDRPYRSSAWAHSDCLLLAFKRKELRAVIRSNPDLAMEIIDGLIQLFAGVVDAIERQAEGSAADGGAKEATARG